DLVDELDLCGGEVDVRGHEVEVLDAAGQDGVENRGGVVNEEVVDGDVQLLVADPQTGRERALRVEVDEEDLTAELRECGTHVDRRGELTDPALLVTHGADGRRPMRGRRLRVWQRADGAPREPEFLLGLIEKRVGALRCQALSLVYRSF